MENIKGIGGVISIFRNELSVWNVESDCQSLFD